MNRATTIGLAATLGLIAGCTAGTTPQQLVSDDQVHLATSLEQLDTMVLSATDAGEQVSGLELRLVDAPVEADAVNITFCGVQVKALTEGDIRDSEHHAPGLQPHQREDDDSATEMKHEDTGRSRSGNLDGDSEPEPDDESPTGEAPSNSTAGWLTLSSECVSVDLLTLQDGVFESLGFAALAPGKYGQIRLMLTESSVVVGGETFDLGVPSSAHNGLKVIGGFELQEGVVTTLTVDFDAGRSIQYRRDREYLMRPVIFLAGTERHSVHDGIRFRRHDTHQHRGADSPQDNNGAEDIHEESVD